MGPRHDIDGVHLHEAQPLDESLHRRRGGPPPGIGLAVVNPLPGTPGIASGETQESYRSRVLDAGLAASQGVSRYLKTLLGNVPGAQKRLISARLLAGVGWQILCGGGDPYDVAGAIFDSMFYLPGLVGSTIGITGIT